MCGENNDCHQIKNKLNYVKKKISFLKSIHFFIGKKKKMKKMKKKIIIKMM